MEPGATTTSAAPLTPAPPSPAHAAVARRAVRLLAQRLLDVALATRAGLAVTNRLHRRLTLEQKRRFYYWFFEEPCRTRGVWTADVAGRGVRLAVGPQLPYGWAVATAFHGYDPELHQLYEALLRSPRRPRVFFDVGANYGLHSLKFLVHGVRTVSFEPNPACHAYFRRCARLSRVRCDIRGVALTDAPGWAELAFPRRATFMGTLSSEVKARWAERPDVAVVRVPCTTLDDAAADVGVLPDLLKIDTEGCELAVLRGGGHVLATARPAIVFESWRASADRPPLFALLEAADYVIQPLTFPLREGPVLSAAAFIDAEATNFFAYPRVSTPGFSLGAAA